jgi:PIN domain nuclease of toxin-antitoxin system
VIVLDTHVWVWLVSDSQRLSAAAIRTLEAADVIGISAISCWELTTLVTRGRVELDRDVEAWIEGALTVDGRLELLAVTRAIAVRAGALAEVLHGDPADRIIAASAIESRAPLVTKDARVRSWARRSGAVKAVW